MICSPPYRSFNFNPRSPCGERRCIHILSCIQGTYFNPRSPCGERRTASSMSWPDSPFQPTLPVRGATMIEEMERLNKKISTHAPRAGSDPHSCRAPSSCPHFNPRSPCGERRGISAIYSASSRFQPTLPVRGATHAEWTARSTRCISTHAPRAGSDPKRCGRSSAPSYFNPRSPCGERLSRYFFNISPPPFQPTLPVRGATDASKPYSEYIRYFNPRSPCGERRAMVGMTMDDVEFQPTLPVRGATDKPPAYVRSMRISTHAPRAASDLAGRSV